MPPRPVASSPAERGPSLESIYRVSLRIDLCEGNKIISFRKFISPQPVSGSSKRKKNPGALGTCPVCPLVKTALLSTVAPGGGHCPICRRPGDATVYRPRLATARGLFVLTAAGRRCTRTARGQSLAIRDWERLPSRPIGPRICALLRDRTFAPDKRLPPRSKITIADICPQMG